jgi:hypothetical protein
MSYNVHKRKAKTGGIIGWTGTKQAVTVRASRSVRRPAARRRGWSRDRTGRRSGATGARGAGTARLLGRGGRGRSIFFLASAAAARMARMRASTSVSVDDAAARGPLASGAAGPTTTTTRGSVSSSVSLDEAMAAAPIRADRGCARG